MPEQCNAYLIEYQHFKPKIDAADLPVLLNSGTPELKCKEQIFCRTPFGYGLYKP
jgi:hypothetical protein